MKSYLGAASVMFALLSSPLLAAEQDPWEGFNRKVFAFNEFCDRYFMKPVAKGYQWLMPDVADRAVSNVFSNLGDVVVFANDIFQFKFSDAGVDLGRVLMNTTLGLAGTIDVATKVGLEKNEEDFGQTLGAWGSDSGPYVVLPFLGPSTLRDAFGRVPDAFVAPLGYVHDVPVRNSLYGLNAVDTRADLIKAESLISGDKYTFMRDAYLQRREALVQDGQVKDDFGDENWDE